MCLLMMSTMLNEPTYSSSVPSMVTRPRETMVTDEGNVTFV